jgi:demethylsterigmatocystin 6-O-methyltransferase
MSSTGARIYYLRNILHDYPDEKCVTLLQNTAAAMDEHSVIFIDELILSNYKSYYQAAEMDLNMMLTLAGAERTDKQWRALIDAAGLQIKEIFTYDRDVRASIIVVERK